MAMESSNGGAIMKYLKQFVDFSVEVYRFKMRSFIYLLTIF